MSYYETVFIARQELTEPQVKALADKYSKVLTDNKAKILKTEHWGLRTLAYKVNKNRKGHYVLIESEANGPAISEVDRLMGIDEDVMRSMTIRLEEPSEGPSVMAKNDSKKADRKEKEAA